MIDNKRYREVEKIHSNNGITVFKAFDLNFDRYVAYKTLEAGFESKIGEELLSREYKNLNEIDSDDIVKLVEYQKGTSLALITEFVEGDLISSLISENHLSLTEKVIVAKAMISALKSVHQNNLIHKDVNPTNIIWNALEKKAVILDFNLASKSNTQHISYTQPKHLMGTLPYISPEQTGRMNRNLDYRTDIYSMGVTLYELFAAKKPFLQTDYLEIIHAHIAISPVRLDKLIDGFPEKLASIVEKMLHKNVDDRYQNLDALIYDLDHYEETSFILGMEDRNQRLLNSPRVYGRSKEIEMLYDYYRKSAVGPLQTVFIKGFSGIGKSTLAKELFHPISKDNGYFLSGKFNQNAQHVPYAAIKNVVLDFINILLIENDDKINKWKLLLNSEVGDNSNLLIQFIPELEIFLERSETELTLSFEENQNRFRRSMFNLISSMTGSGHPIVIFLDDLQWIDSGSLMLIEDLLANSSIEHLLLLGAYRDNEVDEYHPLSRLLGRSELKINEFELEAVKVDDIHEFLNDGFGQGNHTEIAQLIFNKTNGNPFFIQQIIKSMYDNECIIYDGQWQYNYSCAAKLEITDNVADLLLDKMANLTDFEQKVIAVASCLGFTFDATILAKVMVSSYEDITKVLNNLQMKEMIVSLDWDQYIFSHDQIQQAAYRLVDVYKIHQQIARVLYEEQFEVLEIATHISVCLKHDNSIDMPRLKSILIDAGNEAMSNLAYDDAIYYFEYVMLKESLVFNKRIEISSKLIQLYYAVGDFDKLDEMIMTTKASKPKALYLADIYYVELHSYLARTMQAKGLNTALEALDKFGIKLSENVSQEDYSHALGQLFEKFNGPIESLIDLKEMTDEDQLAVMKLLTGLIPLLFNLAPQLLLLVIIEMIHRSLDYGNCKYSSFGYAFFGTIISGSMDMIDDGVAYGRLALKIMDKLNAVSEIPKNNMVTGQHLMYYDEHLNVCLDLLEKGYIKGVEIGDYTYAGFNGHAFCNMSFISGRSLSKVKKIFDTYTAALKKMNQGTVLLFQDIYSETIECLIEEKENNLQLKGNYFDETTQLGSMLEHNHMTGLLVYYYNKTYLAMIYKDYHLALDYVDQMYKYLAGGTGLIHIYLYYQMAALIRLKLYNSMDEVEQFQALKVVDASLAKLASVNTRINFKHRYLIVQAERSRVLNKHNEARAYYDAALSEVVSYRYTNDEALYREIISDYYAELNNAEMMKYYKQSSYQTYLKWGAKVKAKLLLGETTIPSKVPKTPSIFTINAGSEIKEYGQIDLHSILKFSQIVAKEINIDELLKKTLYILLENAGATKASIVSYSKEGDIRLAVVNSALSFELEKTRSLELLDLPLKLINYVYHSKKIVRLGHANMDELFKSDNYIKSHGIQSILSYPLISQGDIIGIVILENDLANDAFSAERTEFLTLLSSQIAISLENATIYSQLEKIVDERTKDLKNKNEELELLNHKLKNISITDGLTGLFNRRRLDESLSYEYKKFLRYNEFFSVILLDIDRFKLVNDVHGHLVGDVVLKKIADELVKITRAVDIVGRWGGEEFLVVCPNTNNDEACNVAEKIRASIEALNITNVGVVTCSLGVASITEGQQIKDVVSMADNHLYHSKEHGRNRVTC